MRRKLLDRLVAERAAGRTVVLATHLTTGDEALLLPLEADGGCVFDGGLAVDDALLEAAADAARKDASTTFEGPAGPIFLRLYAPPVRIVVVGAVHVAQHLAAMARTAGFAVVVVDPRRAFATGERFPGVDLIHRWPDEAMEELQPDGRTAVVTLTHDPKLDDPALLKALVSPAFYIGALGSRRTHARRLERLAAEGVDEADLARIKGPVGLDIGARTPGEIALSVLAEVVASLRRE